VAATPHVTELRVRWTECDPAGIVYFAHYLTYFELGTFEYLRSRGANWGVIRERYGFQSVPRVEAHARFKASARYDDPIAIHTRVGDVSRKVITFESQVYRQSDGRLLAEGHIKVVLTTPEGRAGTLPSELVAWLHGEEPFAAWAPAPAGSAGDGGAPRSLN
jgi:acyl-CoA thioester hydrolase